jgi:hypothetical protein
LNKALLDTDIYSEILKAVDPTVKANAIAYRKAHGVLTLSVPASPSKTSSLSNETRPSWPAASPANWIGSVSLSAPPIRMIAAIALRYGLELATGNTAHFRRIQQIGYPLVLVNWR